jgi:hypothetical protein
MKYKCTYLVATWTFVDPDIVLSMFVVINFLRDCVILLTGTEFVQVLSFVYSCIAIGDPVIKMGEFGSR